VPWSVSTHEIAAHSWEDHAVSLASGILTRVTHRDTLQSLKDGQQ
jgi:hypothetical protein